MSDNTEEVKNPILEVDKSEILPLTDPSNPLGEVDTISEYEIYAKKLKEILPNLPPVDISMENVSMKIKEKVRSKETIPNLLTGTFYQIANICNVGKTREKTILKDLSFRFKPGSSTVVFGPPSSGTSSFLKALAGYLPTRSISGTIKCNNHLLSEYNWKKMCSFCGQLDIQLAPLTVKDTFEFAVHCLNGKGCLKAKGHNNLDDDIEGKTELLVKLLGLGICKDTIVGDEVHRGISGGEKKRVSLGEVLASPARVLLLDKISTGLDSAVTYDICKFLNQWTKIFEGILVCHLLQPDPEVISLFDNVIVLSEGQIIYGGSSNEEVIKSYFNSIGYSIPKEKDIGSFLSEMGKEDSRMVFKENESVQTSIDWMVEKYQNSEVYKIMKEEMKMKSDNNNNNNNNNETKIRNDYCDIMFNQPYAMNFFTYLIFLIKRQSQITFKNKGFIIGRILQQIFMGILLGWIFFGLKKEEYIAKIGIIYMTIAALLNGSMAILVPSFFQKPTLYKQLQQGYFSPPPYILSVVINQYPLQIIETLMISTLIYFMCGFTTSDSGVHYFIFILVMFLGYTSFMSFYMIFIYVFARLGVLQGFLPILGFFLNTFNGFSITRKNIADWLIEFYYFSPISYIMKSIAINEFTSSDYTKEESQMILNAYDFPTEKKEIWYSVIILICEHIAFVVIQMIVLYFCRYDPFPPSKTVDVKDVKAVDESIQSQISIRSSASEVNFKTIDFSFEHVKYTVKVKDPVTKKKVDKVLLNDVSGYVRSHSMTALMGASGAGKTTLLDVISNRKTQGKIEGEYLINGHKYTHKDLCMLSGYVEQQDTLPETETIIEALMFSARLRYPGNPKDSTIRKYVNDTIKLLGLNEYKDMMIGTVETGLPMGVRKLVMVGIELVANPSLLFLDEPTTGLDSSAALLVCQVLQRIAASGRSIICTIHQPSYEIFKLFTDVLLLERGGKVVYFGPLGENGSKVVEYVEKINGVIPIEKDQNPASWMLDVTGAGVDGNNSIAFGDYYLSSDLYQETQHNLENIKHLNSPQISSKSSYAVSIYRQIYEVTKRNFRTTWRRLDYTLARVRIIFLMTLAIGILYFKIDKSTQGGIQSLYASISTYVMSFGMNNMMSIPPILMGLRLSYYREDAMRTYHPFAQLFSQLFVEIIYSVLIATIYLAFYYPMLGLISETKKVLIHWLVSIEWVYFCASIGALFSYLFPTITGSQICVGIIMSFALCVTGFLIPYAELNYPWKALYWINPMMYTIQAMSVNQFKCDSFETNKSVCPITQLGPMRITIHEYFINVYGLKYDLLWNYVGYLAIAIVFIMICMYFAMAKIRFISR